jgi:outer membrane protein TolC
MLREGDQVKFKISSEYNAKWNPENFKKVITAAMKDREVDYLLGLGILVTQAAADPNFQLTKPFLSATILNGDIPQLEYSKDDYSLKKNLSVIIQPQDIERDIEVFNGLKKFKRLHVGIGEEILNNLKEISAILRNYSEIYKTEIIPVPISKDVQQTLNNIDAATEAFYLSAIPRLSNSDRIALIEGLNNRAIPTFSALGPSDLELGVLATNNPDVQLELVRRVALNLFHLIEGARTKDLPVFLIADSKLQINAKTAVAIGYSPNFETRVSATFIYPEAFQQKAPKLSFRDIVKMAEEGNKNLFISQAQTETIRKEKSIARSPMLPQLGLNGSYSYFDNKAVGILFPEQLTQLGVSLRQMIYDDEVISNYRSAGRLTEAAEYQNKSTLLDVYLEAEQSFLRYVQAQLIHSIQVSNLRLTEGNLDIAKMRVEVGHSGQDEVFRWKAELANRKTLVLSTEAFTENQRFTLNQILGMDQSIIWQPEEIDVDPDNFDWLNGQFTSVFESTELISEFTNGLLSYSLESAPELDLLRKQQEAQEISLSQRKRSFYLPKFGADFNYGRNLNQYPAEPMLGKNQYEVGITASLPIFEGTRRYHDIERQRSILKEINSRIQLAEELVEKRVRISVRNLEASFPNIKYTYEAFENARKNFEVVREKYANGIVNITDLLEAQNANFRAEQESVSAMYSFLLDLVGLQRAISFFPETKSQKEIDEFKQTMQQYLNM